jgi:hypothetical protein
MIKEGFTTADLLASARRLPTLGWVGSIVKPRTRYHRARAFIQTRMALAEAFVRARLKPLEVASEAADVGQLIAGLKSADKFDVYWSNEYFYRWLTSVSGAREDSGPITATGRRFVIRTAPAVDTATKQKFLIHLARDGWFPGATVALARCMGRDGKLTEALVLAKKGLAAANRVGAKSNIHVLANQITALERTVAGKPIHRALRRYLGDDDKYLNERTCPLPFEHLEIQENGNATVCCGYWTPEFSMGNVMKRAASEFYNSEQAISIRQSVLDGSFRHCDLVKCAWISGDRLPRKEEVEGRNARRAVETGQLQFERPTKMVLAFDASCNLSCPSCRVRIITEKAPLQIEKEEVIENSILPLLHDMECLNLDPAGELFVSRPLRRLLSKLNRRDFPNLKLEIITNGTLFTPREWVKFPGIHDMIESIRVSTDGATKATFEKLRRGARWEPFLENMRFLARLRQDNVFRLLQFSMTYQLDNFREMPAFVDFCASLDPLSRVVFEKLENLATFAPKEYLRRAVHYAAHPLHSEFLAIIRDPKLRPNRPQLMVDYAGLL